MKSAACLDHLDCGNGTLLNMRFHPKSLEGQDGSRKLKNLVQTFFSMGGMHVQYNVVGSDTLRAAQADPEEHKKPRDPCGRLLGVFRGALQGSSGRYHHPDGTEHVRPVRNPPNTAKSPETVQFQGFFTWKSSLPFSVTGCLCGGGMWESNPPRRAFKPPTSVLKTVRRTSYPTTPMNFKTIT